MRSASSNIFGGNPLDMPRVTRGLVILFVGGSILTAILDMWVGLGAREVIALRPGLVLQGQVWRLATYPWIEWHPLWLLLTAYFLSRFASMLEFDWGGRTFLRRIAILVIVPAILTTLLGLLVPALRGTAFQGIQALMTCLVTAFASANRKSQMTLWPLPVALSGDGILVLEAVVIGLGILFGGSIFAYLHVIVAFGFALAWFRFDLGRDLRVSWLKMRKRRLEKGVTTLRRQRNLRVVRGDEPDDETRYLH